MNRKIVSVIQYVLVLGLGIFLIWWQIRSLSPEQTTAFRSALKDTNYWFIIPIVFMALSSHLSRAMRWKLLMEPVGMRPKTSNTFFVVMIGYLANSAVPRLGEILRCTFLARYEKLPVDKLVGTMVVERAFDMICYALFIGITLLLQVDVVGDFLWAMIKPVFSATGWKAWLEIAIIIAVIIGIYFSLRSLFKKHPNNKLIQKIHVFYNHTIEGFKSIRKLKRRKSFIAHTLFIWGMYLLQIYLGFFAMKGTEGLSIKAAFSVLTLVTLAMIITPGGIGSFPLFVASTLGIYGISEAVGVAFGWLMWGITTAIVVVFGGLCFFLIALLNKSSQHESNIGNTGQDIRSAQP